MYAPMGQNASGDLREYMRTTQLRISKRASCLDHASLRRVLGHYATGVAILTVVSRSGFHIGITVNSFTSVSLKPPLVSVCLGKFLISLTEIRSASAFNVNILCRGQEHLSSQFSRPGAEKWDGVTFGIADNGARTIEPNLAVLECGRHKIVSAGDHCILLGRVERCHVNSVKEPLVFYRGQYRTLMQMAAGHE
jgi:flavin reductase (DIM6/NTAB) family NADH-FMN oxidoreductase RutF